MGEKRTYFVKENKNKTAKRELDSHNKVSVPPSNINSW